MSTYDIAFANKLAEVAQGIVTQGLDSHEARRTVAYLSRLSMELSLKALLERAGKPVAEIKSHWHNLRALLVEVGKCEVEAEVTSGSREWCPASRLRAVTVTFQGNAVPVGMVLDAEDHGASIYPNEIRYGEEVRDFPPEVLALAAARVVAWVEEHWGVVRLAKQ
jgi:hypothetical protein